MNKLTKYTSGALAAVGMAAGMGAVAAPAIAAPLPPYDCTVAIPLLEESNPIVLGAVGCKDNTQKFLEENKAEEGPGNSENAPGHNRGGLI